MTLIDNIFKELQDKVDNGERINVSHEKIIDLIKNPDKNVTQMWLANEKIENNYKVTVKYRGGKTIKYIENNNPIFQESDACFPYLKEIIGNKSINFGKNNKLIDSFKKLAPPQYFRGDVFSNRPVAAVDIESCYYSIYSRITADTCYVPGKFIVFGDMAWKDLETLKKYKEMRNSLPNIQSGGTYFAWGCKKKELYSYDSSKFPTGNSCIWLLIQDIVHSVANMVIRAGAYRWHTDGGIVPLDNVERLCKQVYEDTWGILNLRIEDTDEHGSLTNINNYCVGEKRTTHFTPIEKEAVYEPINNVDTRDRAWIEHVCSEIYTHA